MRIGSVVLAGALGVGVLLWWRFAARAGGSGTFPEVPFPPGTVVIKRLEPQVNLRATSVVLARTRLRPAEVDRFYRSRLSSSGWSECLKPFSGTERRPLAFVRGAWELTVLAFADPALRETTILAQLRPAATGRSSLPRGAVSARLAGFPLYPGVEGALLIENDGTVTILYETDASLQHVAEFYRRRLSQGQRPFAQLSPASDWASGSYLFRQWPVVINLCRRPAGGTSALIIVNQRRTGQIAGVSAWSGAGIW